MKNNHRKKGVKITSVNTKKFIASAALGTLLVVVPSALYYGAEYQGELWAPAYLEDEDFTVGEDGELYYYLDVGEHTILVSRNDSLKHVIEKVDGYEISKVEVNSWRDNNSVTYVNTQPVKVKLTGKNDVFFFFDEFGTVVEEQEYQKVLAKR